MTESKAVQELLNAIPCSCELHSEGHYDHCTKQRVRAVLAELADVTKERDRYRKSLQEIRDFPVHYEPVGVAFAVQEMASEVLKGDK